MIKIAKKVIPLIVLIIIINSLSACTGYLHKNMIYNNKGSWVGDNISLTCFMLREDNESLDEYKWPEGELTLEGKKYNLVFRTHYRTRVRIYDKEKVDAVFNGENEGLTDKEIKNKAYSGENLMFVVFTRFTWNKAYLRVDQDHLYKGGKTQTDLVGHTFVLKKQK